MNELNSEQHALIRNHEMFPTEAIAKRCGWGVILTANACLLILILASPHHPVYDESIFLNATKLLHAAGFSKRFLLDFPGAAGPLHTLVYYPFIRLGATFPYLRLVSFGLLLGSALLLARLSEKTGLASQRPHCIGATLVGGIFTVLPTAGVSAGMALTEMPAMFFLSLSLFLLASASSAATLRASTAFAAAAGLTLGIAVLGRQNYLVVLPGLLVLLLSDTHKWIRNALTIAVVCLLTIAVVSPVFLIWGWLEPPAYASTDVGISLWNGVLAMGYAGLIGFLIAPEIIRSGKWPILAAIITATAIWSMVGAAFMPMHSVLPDLLGQSGAILVADFFGWVVSLIATYFLVCFLSYLWCDRNNGMILLFGAVALIGLASNAKITHQFSSRYVFVFLPFLLLSLAPAMRVTWHLPVRVAIGAGISLMSISSYFFLIRP
jgi:hypothetical protein